MTLAQTTKKADEQAKAPNDCFEGRLKGFEVKRICLMKGEAQASLQ
jgi:hypothetical protein